MGLHTRLHGFASFEISLALFVVLVLLLSAIDIIVDVHADVALAKCEVLNSNGLVFGKRRRIPDTLSNKQGRTFRIVHIGGVFFMEALFIDAVFSVNHVVIVFSKRRRTLEQVMRIIEVSLANI